MSALTDVLRGLQSMTGWQENLYKDIHAHPELSFQETRTAAQGGQKMLPLASEATCSTVRSGASLVIGLWTQIGFRLLHG
jgi:metal-dependent amidase/aminoacylase/carboxypeptidase family protein